MSSPILKVVPVDAFDLAVFEGALAYLENNQLADGGKLYPSNAELAAAGARLREVERGIAALTPAQRRASRWATQTEIARALLQVAAARGYACSLTSADEPWDDAGLTKQAKRDRLTWLSVFLMRGEATLGYYLEGDEDMLGELAQALAEVAGAQLTFVAEETVPAGAVALYLPTTKR